MGRVLNWDAETLARELTYYDARVAAEINSQNQPDDHTADDARLDARDVRLGERASGRVIQLVEDPDSEHQSG